MHGADGRDYAGSNTSRCSRMQPFLVLSIVTAVRDFLPYHTPHFTRTTSESYHPDNPSACRAGNLRRGHMLQNPTPLLLLDLSVNKKWSDTPQEAISSLIIGGIANPSILDRHPLSGSTTIICSWNIKTDRSQYTQITALIC